MEVIGISGKAGSGKDFVGREILRPSGYKPFAFAWHMKNEAVGHGYNYDDVHFNKPPEVREFLQRRGTEEGWQKYGRYYWTKIAGAWLRTLHDELGVTRVYVPDVRFPHECEFIRSMGGYLIRLELGNRAPRLTGQAAQHPSETALDSWTDWDLIVENNLNVTKAEMRSLMQAVDIPV